ncbi:MAG: hypothetical protein A4E19_08605 [Nitrospira sp. SG-bin1]|nr:MAG: hypothetical protein A4E19_08605 [Nitrospira sp. SG-bin1]
MNAGKYGRSSTALKELLTLDPNNMEARRLFATLHLRLGSLIPARQAFDSLIDEAFQRQDYWLAESLLREYLAAGPRCVPYLEKLGALYQEKGDALEAVAEYGKAVDILIEDPDPDNPHHPSELYAKIRELAPASPVAFRLASFFDSQTGELLARQPNDAEQSTIAPSEDMSEGSHGIQAGSEPMDGVMPWEIQDARTTESESFTIANVPSSESPNSPTFTDSPAPPDQSLDEALPTSNPPRHESIASHVSEVQVAASEEPLIHERESTPADARMDESTGHIVLGDVSPSTTPSEPAAELFKTQPTPDPVMSTVDPSVALQQHMLLAETRSEPSVDVNSAPTVSALVTPADVQEPPASLAQSNEDVSLLPSSWIEEAAPPAFRIAEPTTHGVAESEDNPPFQLARAEANEVVPQEPLSTAAPSSPEPVSNQEISEPWKHPGFSWKSVFDSAWKFKDDPAAQIVPAELTRTHVEEPSAPASAASPLCEQVSDEQAVEITKHEGSMPFQNEAVSASPIAPMPWDQVQESVLSIPPAQADSPMAENMKSAVAHSSDRPELDSTSKVRESLAQSPSPQDSSAPDTDSFSIAKTTQTATFPEPEISPVGSKQTSFPIEKPLTVTDPAQQLPAMSARMIDVPEPLEAPMAAIPPPLLENRPVAGDVVTPPKVPSQNVGSILETSNDSSTVIVENLVQEYPVAPSPLTSEVSSRETEETLPPSSTARQRILESPPDMTTTPHLAKESTEVETHESQPQATAFVEARIPTPDPAPEQDEWGKEGESIRFIEQPQTSSAAHVHPAISERQENSRSMSVAAAVDVLFESSRNVRATETREHVAEVKPSRKSSSALSRARIAIAGFVSTCFSTTRAIVMTCVGLVMLSVILIALGIGAIGLTWVIMEESPSPAFQSLTTTPQQTLSDFKKNGYFLLLGIDAPSGQDPIQAGHDRKFDITDGNLALACLGGSGSRLVEGSNASANVMRGWVRSSDPVGAFKSHQETIKGWTSQHQLMLHRYGQWQKLSFEDWGYGQPGSPPCTAMAFAHQLHVADGFLHSADLGVDRLETDMEAWRIVLAQARTLPVKMLALQAINDDIAVASGLLVRSDFEGRYLGSLTKILRPLDQVELSLRWPMQSELVSASKTYETRMKAARAEEQSVYTMVASTLPLPMQRRLNDYADYYDASNKAAAEGKYSSLPKWKTYIDFPASGLMHYLTNPIENIIGLEPLPAWDLYSGLVVDTDAHLRLASLQTWLRRGSAEGDLLTRIAKAGQSFYDPYTGLPMLVNMKKGALYSVGHDGKDQDADPQSDVVVEIPAGQTPAVSGKSSSSSSKLR